MVKENFREEKKLFHPMTQTNRRKSRTSEKTNLRIFFKGLFVGFVVVAVCVWLFFFIVNIKMSLYFKKILDITTIKNETDTTENFTVNKFAILAGTTTQPLPGSSSMINIDWDDLPNPNPFCDSRDNLKFRDTEKLIDSFIANQTNILAKRFNWFIYSKLRRTCEDIFAHYNY